jgi:hypothetical protein
MIFLLGVVPAKRGDPYAVSPMMRKALVALEHVGRP